MKQMQKKYVTKPMVLLLVFLFTSGNPSIFSQHRENQENQLEKTFAWAVMDYQKGKYYDVTQDLELLLTYYDDDATAEEPDSQKLKGKIHLLLGAAYEQTGRLQKAEKNYQSAKEILEPGNREIEGIDLGYLKVFQRIIMDNKAGVPAKKGVIERPLAKPKKRRISPLIIVGIAAVIGVVTAVLLSRKKEEPGEIIMEPNYDTRVLGIEWVQIPAGEFMMGDNFNEGEGDELPVHAVYLDEYYISKYEITFAQYDTFCEETLRQSLFDAGWGRGNRPVINVLRSSAEEFCIWLSQKTGKDIRLPTEAQWEKAARGTDQRRYPWGNSPPDCNKANYDCDTQTHPVGSHPEGVSPYGVHDMAGNVSEWCFDEYEYGFYSISQYSNPVNNPPANPTSRIYFVIRGGSWDSVQQLTPRSADREDGSVYYGVVPGTPGTKNSTLGFRIVWKNH